MTIKQYSTMQRLLGVIEGVASGLSEDMAAALFDALEALSNTIDEAWEADNGGSE